MVQETDINGTWEIVTHTSGAVSRILVTPSPYFESHRPVYIEPVMKTFKQQVLDILDDATVKSKIKSIATAEIIGD